MPSADSDTRYRLFLGLARKTEVRVHRFADDESRSIDAAGLQSQLDRGHPT
jgi:hypothetical protein